MEIYQVGLLHGTVQAVCVKTELHAVLGHDVAGAGGAGAGKVAVLGHIVTGSGYYGAGAGGDVEGVFHVTSGAHNIHVFIGLQLDGNAGLQDPVAEAQQFVHRDAAQLQHAHQGGQLLTGILFLGNVDEDFARFFAGQILVVENLF